LLEDLRLPGAKPPDLCYVHNFRQPDAPLALQLPAGRGRIFAKDMHDLVGHLRRALPTLFESDPYKQARRRLETELQTRLRRLFEGFEKRVASQGFKIVQVPMGPVQRTEIVPFVDAKPVPFEELRAQAANDAKRRTVRQLETKHARLAAELEDLLRDARRFERELRGAVQNLDREYAAQLVRGPLQDLREKYCEVPRVLEFLDLAAESVLEVVGTRAAAAAPEPAETQEASAAPAPAFEEFLVNVAVDNAGATRPPVVLESSPTSKNLFGSVERIVDRQGVWRSDHMSVRAGSLMRANGGFLVFNLLDAAMEPAVWPTLKRVLKNCQAEIPSQDGLTALVGSGVKPEPVDLRIKVVVLGDAFLYQTLYDHDEEFRKIFKVKSEFDSSMPRNRRALHDYARFIATLCDAESLLPFDASGVAAIVEAGSRLAGRQTKLSTRFSDIADVVREAHYWARKTGRRVVGEADVDRAVQERTSRVGLVESKLQETFDTGQMLIETRRKRIGQVNALTIFDFGDHTFGRPARITCQVSMGRTGIINIEREANLSGATHDKGVLILAGYLRSLYAQDKPLTLSASLAFEQSYGGVEGDSATAAEVFVLLSAIANVPLRQDLAVTGSVDQRGQIQPVGGVNEKIEGFFDVCKARGLTGKQGAVIPRQNIADLMLRKDVVEAVRRGRFHVYAIRNIDEGLELMTGLRAGRRRRFRFEPDTLHWRVDNALLELAETIKEFVDGNDTPSGRPPTPGLADEDGEGGVELRRRAARQRRRAVPLRSRACAAAQPRRAAAPACSSGAGVKPFDRQVLEAVVRLPTAPFREHWVRAAIERQAQELGLPVRSDPYGNVYVSYREGRSDPVAFTAHMDHPGFEITEGGTRARAAFLGGVAAENMASAPVLCFADRAGARQAVPPVPVRGRIVRVTSVPAAGRRPDLVLDLDLEAPVAAGDFGVFDVVGLEIEAGQLRARALDNLLSCALILATLASLKSRGATCRRRRRVHARRGSRLRRRGRRAAQPAPGHRMPARRPRDQQGNGRRAHGRRTGAARRRPHDVLRSRHGFVAHSTRRGHRGARARLRVPARPHDRRGLRSLALHLARPAHRRSRARTRQLPQHDARGRHRRRIHQRRGFRQRSAVARRSGDASARGGSAGGAPRRARCGLRSAGAAAAGASHERLSPSRKRHRPAARAAGRCTSGRRNDLRPPCP
jgi:ATP-dependent Lon protease